MAFEIEVASTLRGLGWQAELTAGSGDGGADVIARCGEELLVVQCKDWIGPVGVDAVRDVHAARSKSSASAAVVVARNGFTAAAREEARLLSVGLYRIAEIMPGGGLDRSAAGRRLREQAAQAREEARVAALMAEWARYDTARASWEERRQRLPLSLAGLGTGSLAVAALTFTLLQDHGGWAVLAILAWCIAVAKLLERVLPGAPPREPESPRPAAVLPCPACGQLLRLPRGRAGKVTCGACGRREWYET